MDVIYVVEWRVFKEWTDGKAFWAWESYVQHFFDSHDKASKYLNAAQQSHKTSLFRIESFERTKFNGPY